MSEFGWRNGTILYYSDADECQKKDKRGLIDVTTHTETNEDLTLRTMFGCKTGFGYGRRLGGVVCPLVCKSYQMVYIGI